MAINHAATADASFSGTGAANWNAAHTGTAGDGGFAFKYVFDTGTGGSPATGKIQYNNATPGSATLLYIYETDASSQVIDAILDDMEIGDAIMIANDDKSKFHVFRVNDNFTSGASVDTIPVTYLFGTANFSNADTVYLAFKPGPHETFIGRAMAISKSIFSM